MTNQELFDRVVSHLRIQGTPATDEHGACMYRTEDGLRCAIGCLIPDDRYDPRWEGKASRSVVRGWDQEILSAAGIESQQRELAYALQTAHDTWGDDCGPLDEINLARIATEYGLKY